MFWNIHGQFHPTLNRSCLYKFTNFLPVDYFSAAFRRPEMYLRILKNPPGRGYDVNMLFSQSISFKRADETAEVDTVLVFCVQFCAHKLKRLHQMEKRSETKRSLKQPLMYTVVPHYNVVHPSRPCNFYMLSLQCTKAHCVLCPE